MIDGVDSYLATDGPVTAPPDYTGPCPLVAPLKIEESDNVPCDAPVFDDAIAQQTMIVPEPRKIEQFESPRDTPGWVRGREDGIETFTGPDGRVWTRAQTGEPEDAIVTFTGPRSRGMTPMRLVLAEFSYALKGAATRKRREERELRKRGYDV